MGEKYREIEVNEEMLTRLFGPAEEIERQNNLARMRRTHYNMMPIPEQISHHRSIETPVEPIIDDWGDDD